MMPDWSSAWFWKNLVAALALPPASLLILLFIGIWLWRRCRSAGAALLLIVFVFSWALSTPYIGHLLLGLPGETRPFDPGTLQYFKPEERPQAIVVLGAGRTRGAREYDPAGTADAAGPLLPETLSNLSLSRARYAAWLHRATGLPVVTVGGLPEGGAASEAQLMKLVLEREMGTPVRATEDQSRNTVESAQMALKLLSPLGVKRVLLVTDYWHSPRSRSAFREAGFEVIAAPMGFSSFDPGDPREWLPTARGMAMSRTALREVAGYGWSRVTRLVGL
ncbi:YdcF family protein [soil metagenome]